MSGKLWRCGQCDRLVNRFANGYTCPDCGSTAGSHVMRPFAL